MVLMQVHIERYSLSAASLLQRHHPQVGRIHSHYARLLNIATPDGYLLTLQGPGPLQAPCAASLAEDVESGTSHLAPGDLVVQNDREPGALCLVTTTATCWDGRLLPLATLTTATLRSTGEKLAQWLAQHAREQGIVPVLAALQGEMVQSPLHRRLFAALAPLLAGRSMSPGTIMDMAAQVIGLGEGLTPSGDDLLVGFLAVLHLSGHVSQLQHDLAWLESLTANTTDLSAAFLRCAIEGHFSEPMVALMRALYHVDACDWRVCAADLARVGHSSGVDAMVGIVVANALLSSPTRSPIN